MNNCILKIKSEEQELFVLSFIPEIKKPGNISLFPGSI